VLALATQDISEMILKKYVSSASLRARAVRTQLILAQHVSQATIYSEERADKVVLKTIS